MSNPASALYISFFPELNASPVPLPVGAVFVVANSLVVSDKAVTAKRCYNLRVVETLVAARILAKALGVKVDDRERLTLREIVGRYAGETIGRGQKGGLNEDDLKEALKVVLGKLGVLKPTSDPSRSGVLMEEMIEMSRLEPKVFHEVYLSWIEGASLFLFVRAKGCLY